MLENKLFRILSINGTGAEIELIPECEIYSAHFPGRPITPGVCLVQAATELISRATSTTLKLTGAKDIKFASVISPDETGAIRYEFTRSGDSGTGQVWNVLVFDREKLCAKMSLIYEI